ncbi:cytochrome b/b6 domain-containing protein [Elioraea sp.]|uniref:cytochrome b/b6 domain-containing protein n=1 Tax=Elioraea sp. TaxID=2185103 RepID=UPI003F6EC352
MRGEGDATVETRVWDLPTRLFHWALAITLVGSFLTVRAHDMRLHSYCGYAALTLVLFRILWGLFGSESARFASFLRGPGAVMAHLKAMIARRPDHETTHNALGGWAVMLMLGLVLAQGATGLFANDDIIFRGPLFPLAGKEMSDRLTTWHYRISDLLLIVVIVHVLAVFAYRLAGHQLIEAMVTGVKPLPAGTRAPRPAGIAPAAVALAIAAGTVWAVVTLLV